MAGPTSVVYPIGDVDYRTAIDVLATDLGKTWNQTKMWMDTHLGSHTQSAASSYLRSQGWQYVQSTSGYAYGWQKMGTLQFNTAVQDSLDSNLGSVTTGNFSMLAKTQWIQDTLGRDVMTLGKGVWGTDVNKYALTGPIGIAAGAVMAGAKLGKFVAGTLYQNSPDVWDATGMGSMNPETWGAITRGDDSWNAQLLNYILGIDGDTGETTGYMDEMALAYYAQYLATLGAFNIPQEYATNDIYDSSDKASYFTLDVINQPMYYTTSKTVGLSYREYNTGKIASMTFTGEWEYAVRTQHGWFFVKSGSDSSEVSFTVHYHLIRGDGTTSDGDNNSGVTSLPLGKSPYTWGGYRDETIYSRNTILDSTPSIPIGVTLPSSYQPRNIANDIINYIKFGSSHSGGGVEGIDPQPNSSNPNITGWDNPQDTLASLKQQYPTWWDDAITNTTANPDGTTTTTTYVPVPLIDGMFNSANDPQPTNTDRVSTDTAVNPDTAPQDLLDLITDILLDLQPKTDPQTQPDTETPVPNPPTTGDGETPTTVIPTGTASALYAIYNPTQGELNSFGAWLWSPNFVDQLLKMFNDPMQAIIGLHKVFVTPVISGRQNIQVGYLDSGVSSNTVGAQYVTIDCGSVSLPEYFGNVFDYSPYTQVDIFLPFIGIHRLDVADVMRSTIGVVYHVDVLTGACLAEINVNRDGAGGTLYTFSGNCAVQYPLSSGSYMGIISTVASVATSALAGFAGGGPVGAAMGGGMAAIHGSGATISKSGSLSGNSGAMGGKIPYLIISRPQTTLASTFPNQQGYPTNYSATLGEYTGFVQCRALHTDGIAATHDELAEIRRYLETGVIV